MDRASLIFTVLLWQHLFDCALQTKYLQMDLYSDNSSVDLMDGFSLAGVAVEDFGPPPAHPAAPAGAMDAFGPPAPADFGYVMPSRGMAPVRMPNPPYCGVWHTATQHSSVYVSAPMSRTGPRMSLAGLQPSRVDDLLARRAALDQELFALVSFSLLS